MKPARSRASDASAGSPKSPGSTPPTTRAASAPAGQVGVPHALDLSASRGVGHRTPAGKQRRQRAGLDRPELAGPARHPGELCAGALGQCGSGAQRSRRGRQPLADQDQRAVGAQRVDHVGVERPQRGSLRAGHGRDQDAAELGQAVGRKGRDRPHAHPATTRGLVQAEEDDRRLLLGLEADQKRRCCVLNRRVRDVLRCHTRHVRAEERELLVAARPGAEVDVVGRQGDARELRVGVGVLLGEPPAGQHADTTAVDGLPQSGGGALERVWPARLNQSAGGVADERRRQPIGLSRVLERPAALVAVPLLVHVGILAGQPAGNPAAPPVRALGASRRAVLAHRVGRLQVERAGPEPVGRPGQRADRADLHGVAGEVRLERHLGGRADLLLGAALEQVDERVARDLVGEARAPLAQHAAFAVEQHVRRDRDRLRERSLDVVESRIRPAVAHGLVLQRALAALVADRAVERVVDEQEFHDALLGLVGHGRRELGLDDHARHDGRGARRRRFRHAATVAHVGDLDQALPAGARGFEQRVVAEPRDLDAELLGRPDQQGALRHGDLEPVDGDGDQVLLGGRAHEATSTG